MSELNILDDHDYEMAVLFAAEEGLSEEEIDRRAGAILEQLIPMKTAASIYRLLSEGRLIARLNKTGDDLELYAVGDPNE